MFKLTDGYLNRLVFSEGVNLYTCASVFINRMRNVYYNGNKQISGQILVLIRNTNTATTNY